MENENTHINNTEDIETANSGKVWNLLRIKKLDWYIIKKLVSTFFFAIMILALISCVIDYSEKVDAIVAKKVPFAEVANYYKNFIPHITALLFPLFIFIATIFFTSKLAYKSEIIAMLAAGVSFPRFLRPYVIGGGFLCVVSLVANHWIIPVANKQRIHFEDSYINEGNYTNAGDNIHLGISKDVYIYMQNFNFSTLTGNRFTCEKISGTMLKEKLMADYVNYDTVKKMWHMHNVVIRYNDSASERLHKVFDTSIKYPFVPLDLSKTDAIKEALTTPQLNSYIAQEQLRGRENLNLYYIEEDRRSAQPFAGFVLTLMGACIASRKIRGGSGLHLALGISISATYILFMQLSTTFSAKSTLSPMLAVWIPNIIFAGVAYLLFRRQSK